MLTFEPVSFQEVAGILPPSSFPDLAVLIAARPLITKHLMPTGPAQGSDTALKGWRCAIRGTLAGKSFVDPGVAGKLIEQVTSKQVQPETLLTRKLTEREVEVLRLIARGLNNPEIVARLHLSEGTVRNHVSAILNKLDASDRTQAAVIAIQPGL